MCGKSAEDARAVTASSSVFSDCVPASRNCEDCALTGFCSGQCLETHHCAPGRVASDDALEEESERAKYQERFLAWQKDTNFLRVLLLRLVLGSASEAESHLVVLHLDYISKAAPHQHFKPHGVVENIPDIDVGVVHGGSLKSIASQRYEGQRRLPVSQMFVPIVVMVHFPSEKKPLPTVVCGCPHLMSRELLDRRDGTFALPTGPTGRSVSVDETLKLMSKVQASNAARSAPSVARA